MIKKNDAKEIGKPGLHVLAIGASFNPPQCRSSAGYVLLVEVRSKLPALIIVLL